MQSHGLGMQNNALKTTDGMVSSSYYQQLGPGFTNQRYNGTRNAISIRAAFSPFACFLSPPVSREGENLPLN